MYISAVRASGMQGCKVGVVGVRCDITLYYVIPGRTLDSAMFVVVSFGHAPQQSRLDRGSGVREGGRGLQGAADTTIDVVSSTAPSRSAFFLVGSVGGRQQKVIPR